jgi:outer membrane receptor for ferrienterochelin and colicins
MVKRIEVVKGPASTLYGSEAVAGIINVITVDPLSAKRFAADLSGTTQGEWNADLSASVKLKKANTLIGFNVFRFNNPLDVNNDNFTDLTLQTRYSLFNKWSFDRKNNLPASFAVRLLSENRWGGELQWTPAFKGGDSIYGESIDTRRVEWIGQYGITKNVLAEASYNYHWQDSYYGQTWYKGMQHTGFAQLRWTKQKGKNNWSAGIPFRYIHYDDNTPATLGTGGTNRPSVQTMVAAFAQNEYSISKKLTIMPGLRYEHTNLQGGVAAPRLALKWKPDGRQTFRLSGGNGFRIVNLFTEDHAAISGFREVVIAENLKPERSWNINANYATQINAGKSLINIDASAFYTWFVNRIIPDYDTDPQKIIYANLEGGAISRGLSANIDWVAPNGIRATAGITYMDVYVRETDDDGKMVKNRQVYAPEWSGTYLLSVPVKKWSATFDLTGTFTGPMRLPVFPNDFRPEYSPWYTLLNLQATKRFGRHVEIYVSGKNLLNFLPRNPILHPDDPFDRPGGRYWLADGSPNPVTNPNGFTFDPSYNYAPMQGFRLMLGVRLHMH